MKISVLLAALLLLFSLHGLKTVSRVQDLIVKQPQAVSALGSRQRSSRLSHNLFVPLSYRFVSEPY